MARGLNMAWANSLLDKQVLVRTMGEKPKSIKPRLEYLLKVGWMGHFSHL